jgi:hypothetical protein
LLTTNKQGRNAAHRLTHKFSGIHQHRGTHKNMRSP